MRVYIYIIIIIGFSFTECKKKATIKLPASEKKLVVTCFINPDDALLRVALHSSAHKFSNNTYENDVIEDGTVWLHSADKSVEITFDKNYYAYVIGSDEFPVLAGQTYSLIASAPGFPTVKAATSIPLHKFSITDFKMNVVSKTDTYVEVYYSFGVADLPGTTYAALHQQVAEVSEDSSNFYPSTSMFLRRSADFHDDAYQTKTHYYSKTQNDQIIYERGLQGIYFTALNCSREFYLYNRSLQQTRELEENPFTEPIMIFSNIENGLGCFGGYQSTIRGELIQ